MGWLRLIAQPFIVAFAMGIGILDNGQSIFDADGVAQTPNSLCAAPEVSEFSVTVQIDRTPNIATASIRTRESLRDTEQRITNLALLEKQIDTYRKLKPVYDRYKVSKDKEKFLRGFESEIILFEAAAKEIKKAGLTKLPSAEKLKAELDGLSTRKAALQAELRKVQREEKEYDTLLQNTDFLLIQPQIKQKEKQWHIE